MGVIPDKNRDVKRLQRDGVRGVFLAAFRDAKVGDDVDVAGTKCLENFGPVFFHRRSAAVSPPLLSIG